MRRPVRSVGKGYGVDGDVLVKATRWEDGTTTLEVETLADGVTPSGIVVDELRADSLPTLLPAGSANGEDDP